MATVSKTPGGCAGRVCDGAVALLRADAVAVVLVGEVVAARVVVGVDVARGPREPLQAVLGRPPLRRAAAHAHYRSLSLFCVWALNSVDMRIRLRGK